MMRSKIMLFSLMLMTILMLVACNEDETESKDASESTTNDEKETVSIMLDWYPNAVHSYLYVAQEKGYFEDENIDVEFQFPANPTDPLTLAASGKITMGLYYQPDEIGRPHV